jgi:tryptophan-rich sensory protein
MFDTSSLNVQPGRYALIAESILPPLLIVLIAGSMFRPSNDAGKQVIGRPSPIAFGMIWFLICALWLIALVIVALDTIDTLSLCVIGVFSLIAIIASFAWCVLYKFKWKVIGAQVLVGAFACMMVTTITCLASETPSDSKVVGSMFFGLIASWLSFASLLSFLDLNVPNVALT